MISVYLLVAQIAILCMIFCVLFAVYMGFYKKIKVETIVFEEKKVLTYNFVGPVSDFGKAMIRVCNIFKKEFNQDLDCKSFGCIHYTSDKDVESPDYMKWSVFAVIERQDLLDQIITKNSEEFQIVTIPKSRVAHACFPFKNLLSYTFGRSVVYPALENYVKTNGNLPTHGCVELYHIDDSPLEYFFFLENEDFFSSLKEHESENTKLW
ncbi:hypothetical protein WA158_005230 [Blastocystis sp. Blastoise]